MRIQGLRQNLRTLAGIAALAACMTGTSAAEVVDFSFSNVVGNVNGTVTGTLTLPTACDTGCTGQAATDIQITSFPAGLNSSFGSAPLDASTLFTSHYANSVTTNSAGNITAIQVAFGCSGCNYFLDLNYAGLHNELDLDTAGAYDVRNDNGFSGATYTLSTPEPGTWLMLGTGLAAMVEVKRRRAMR